MRNPNRIKEEEEKKKLNKSSNESIVVSLRKFVIQVPNFHIYLFHVIAGKVREASRRSTSPPTPNRWQNSRLREERGGRRKKKKNHLFHYRHSRVMVFISHSSTVPWHPGPLSLPVIQLTVMSHGFRHISDRIRLLILNGNNNRQPTRQKRKGETRRKEKELAWLGTFFLSPSKKKKKNHQTLSQQ